MSREVIIDVKRRVKCDRCGEVQDAHKTINETGEAMFGNRSADEQAMFFSKEKSGWETRLRFQAATLGWTDGSPVESGQIGFHGELCLSCSTALKEVLERFFADGIAGAIGMAKEQENKVFKDAPTKQCPVIWNGYQCVRNFDHADMHCSATGVIFP